MPRKLVVALAIAFCLPCDGQNVRNSEQVLVWMPIKRLCGRLQRAQKTGMGAVPNANLKLYEAKWRRQCCQDLKLYDSRLTAANGDFDFGDVQSGRYWLSLELNGMETVLPIDVDARHEWGGSCEGQGVVIEGKALSWIAGGYVTM